MNSSVGCLHSPFSLCLLFSAYRLLLCADGTGGPDKHTTTCEAFFFLKGKVSTKGTKCAHGVHLLGDDG